MIIIQQYSYYSDNFDNWFKFTTKYGGLDSLISLIRSNQPYAEIKLFIPHASFQVSTKNGLTTNQEWYKMYESCERLKDSLKIDYIPCGTAIENLRETIYNDSSYLSRDGHHLGYGLARYTDACAYYQSIIYPYTHISILGNSARVKTTEMDKTEQTHPL